MDEAVAVSMSAEPSTAKDAIRGIVDAHMHIWDRSSGESFVAEEHYPALRGRQFLVSDYELTRRQLGAKQAVLVHGPATLRHTLACLDIAEDRPDRFPFVVGWIDLTDPGCLDALHRLRERPTLRGIRYMGTMNRDADRVRKSKVAQEVFEQLQTHALSLDVLAPPHLLKWVRRMARRFPALRVVVDGMGLPGWDGSDVALWEQEIEKTALMPNVFIKLAGLFEASQRVPGVDEAMARTRTVITTFGAERVMFASNWPVVEGIGSAREWRDLAVLCLDRLGLPTSDRALILRGAALNAYSPPPAS